MRTLEIKCLKNDIKNIELDYIKNHIPKRYVESLRFKSEESRNLTLLSGIMIHNNLHIEEDSIQYNKLKKPYLDGGPYFNVSHSKNIVVFTKSDGKIGIDIEIISEKNKNILDYAFNEDERNYILYGKDDYSHIERLTKIWTIKESLFKASGSEIFIEPMSINACGEMTIGGAIEVDSECYEMNNTQSGIHFEKGKQSFLEEKYNVYSYKWNDFFISIASMIEYDCIKMVRDRILGEK